MNKRNLIIDGPGDKYERKETLSYPISLIIILYKEIYFYESNTYFLVNGMEIKTDIGLLKNYKL